MYQYFVVSFFSYFMEMHNIVIIIANTDCSVTSHVFGYLAVVNIEQYYTLTCNVLQRNTNCVVEEYYIFRRNELVSRNKSSAFRADSVSGAVNNYYTCTVTLNGSNFTGNPARIPSLIQCEYKQPCSHALSVNFFFFHPSFSGFFFFFVDH